VGGVTRDELRSVKRLHTELGHVIGVLANDPHLRQHSGAVIGILGVLAEDVQRAADGSSTPIEPDDITDAVGYLRTLRSLKKGGI
jgi:hypothetical protein